MRRYELTDEIKDLSPGQTMGHPCRSERTVLSGIL
jgi:hypothetical protein